MIEGTIGGMHYMYLVLAYRVDTTDPLNFDL